MLTLAGLATMFFALTAVRPLGAGGGSRAGQAGGILIALGSSIPISPYVTTISFTIYVVCRVIGARRTRNGWTPARSARRAAPAETVAIGGRQ